MKIALVHDYLTQRGGAERVFELLCRYFDDADIFTSVYDPKSTIDLSDRSVQTTHLQKIPGTKKYFRLFAPFYYSAFRQLDLQDYDLIISSSASFAKGVKKRPDAKHICFCHNITRFLWDTHTYLQEYSHYKNFHFLINKLFDPMKEVDLQYAQEPDLYVANSSVVAERIRRIYGRNAIVLNYPFESGKFVFSDHKSDFYLVASRLLSYKRIDLTVKAFSELGWPLMIIGDGPERKFLESQATSNIKFTGFVSDAERAYLMAKARAVIVTALEDYGLVPIEANASGTPAITYGSGGVLDTQISGLTGLFFPEQTFSSLKATLLQFEQYSWNHSRIQHHALTNFSESVFFQKVEQIVEQVCGKPMVANVKQPISVSND